MGSPLNEGLGFRVLLIGVPYYVGDLRRGPQLRELPIHIYIYIYIYIYIHMYIYIYIDMMQYKVV